MSNNNTIDLDDLDDDLGIANFADLGSMVEDDNDEDTFTPLGGTPLKDNLDDIDDFFRDIQEDIDDFTEDNRSFVDDEEESEDSDYYNITLSDNILEKLQANDEKLLNLLEAYSNDEIKGVAEYLINNNLIKLEEEEFDFISRLDQVSDDELLMYEVKERCATCTREQLEDLKFKIQQSPAVDNLVKGLRELYKEKEIEIYNQKKSADKTVQEKKYSEYNSDLANEIHELEIISGPFKNNQQFKKEFLPKIKKTMEGNSQFVKELLDNPVNQYKALFYLEMEDKIHDHYRQEVEKAYKKGLSESRSIDNNTRVSQSPSQNRSKSTAKKKQDSFMSIDDL